MSRKESCGVMARNGRKRKSPSKRTLTWLQFWREVAYLAVAFTILFGNPIVWTEQEIVVLIQGPPITESELESLRVPVPEWVQPTGPPI